jgi:superfamily I DNA/RNA helicase
METTIFGPPGTGKTTKLISIVEQALESGMAPDRIAFVSFSRKAAEEARDRALEKLNIGTGDLEWFRTLHSLAFQCLGLSRKQVMHKLDYEKLGDYVGMDLSPRGSIDDAGTFIPSATIGDRYLNIAAFARSMKISLEQAFDIKGDDNMYFQQLRIINNALYSYKKGNDKLDFTDMIEQFNLQRMSPEFDLLIVDEAQDLVPLQWQMVKEVLVPRSKKVYYAGDDDQCIYAWMGVKVRDFLMASDEKIILDKSYRVPNQIHKVANNLVKRLGVRQEKNWVPAERDGKVTWHRDILDVDLTTGEWLILARTNHIANMVARKLYDQGYLYWFQGRGWSISPSVLSGIEVWLRLCKGQYLSAAELKTFSKILSEKAATPVQRKALETLDPEHTYGLDEVLQQLNSSITSQTPWHEVIKVSDRELIYISSVRRMGESILTGKPRIRISTIHKAKGGEADNVALLLDSSRACTESNDQDSETRTFYVGITRARNELHIIESQNRYGFQL